MSPPEPMSWRLVGLAMGMVGFAPAAAIAMMAQG